MGHNDHLHDDYPELPPEAGEDTGSGFEPNDDWLKKAKPDLRHEAMRQWFVSRYWDPANETPYNSEEGGYLYIHGGPYDATGEIGSRFGDMFPEDVVKAVVDDVESEGILEWAPIHTEPDYDADFEYEANRREDPHLFFRQRLTEVDALDATTIEAERKPLLRQLLYSNLIAALEAYLADTMSYWVAVDKKVFRRFVTSCEEFKQQKLSLSQIFERMDALEDDVEKYFQQLVWHRLDKAVPLMDDSLEIGRPAIDKLMKHIVVRHDIVHRGGRTKDGARVTVTDADLKELRTSLTSFINEIESRLQKRFPPADSDLSVENTEF